MPVKVKIEKPKVAPVEFTIRDFAHPDEARARLTGLAIGAGALALVFGLLSIIPYRAQFMAAWAAWILLAAINYAVFGKTRELRHLGIGDGKGRPAPVAAGAPVGPLSDMVSQQARALGVAAGAAASDKAEASLTVGNIIIIPERLRQRLSPAETWAVLAREIGRIKAGDVGLMSLMRRLRQERSVLLRLLGLPLWPLARALEGWRWYAELTADRLALILTRDRKVLAAALLKQATLQLDGVTSAEIDEYLRRPGSVTAESGEVTTHFKLGEVLRDRDDIMERLRGVVLYADSPEYRQACEKLDAAHRKASKTDTGAPPRRQKPGTGSLAGSRRRRLPSRLRPPISHSASG